MRYPCIFGVLFGLIFSSHAAEPKASSSTPSDGVPVLVPPASPVAGAAGLAVPAGSEIVVEGGKVSIRATREQAVVVPLRNVSDRELTVTQVSLNGGSIYVPVAPLVIAPGKVTALSLVMDGSRVMLPGQVALFLRVRDGKAERALPAPFEVGSPDVFGFEPRASWWKVGEEAAPRTVRIVQTPPGVKVTGLKLSNDGFTAQLGEAAIILTPKDTAQPHSTIITLLTEPALPRLTTISAMVVPAPPKHEVPPLPSPSSQP